MSPEGSHRCASCATEFLAFRPGVACPHCGHPAKGGSRIVAESLQIYQRNLRAHGHAIPPTIRVEGLHDDYVFRALFFLKMLDERQPPETEEAVLERCLDSFGETSDPGWRSHFDAFYREVLAARTGQKGKNKDPGIRGPETAA